MSQRRLHTLLEGGSFFESPRWHQGRWWVSDFYRQEVLAVEPDGRAQTVLEVAGRPSGLGWMPDGSLLVVSMADRRILRVTAGDVSLHADVSAYCGGDLNDMVVASDGRLYAGNFGFDSAAQADPVPASLICVDPGGSARVAADGLHFPNGSVIAPDGRTLIVGETGASRYTAFTIARRCAQRPPDLGAGRARARSSRRSRTRSRRCGSGRTGARSTRTATSGRRT